MKTARRCFALSLAAVAVGCADRPVTGPAFDDAPGAELMKARSVAHPVTVLNWNIYIGTDVDVVIQALASPDPTDDLPALLAAIAELAATDFPSRARAIVDEIERSRPDVIGLQEVSIIDVDLSAIGAPQIFLDFLAILQTELAARDLNYDVAAIVTNIDAQPPLPPGLQVRTVDRDALLVASDRVVVTGTPVERNYINNVGPVATGVSLIRGFVMIDVTIDGAPFTIANTHLEPNLSIGDLSLLRAAQAGELMAALGASTPAIVMGDFNDVPGSPMHDVVTGAGFVDAWAGLRPGVAGLTCCHISDLSNKLEDFDERIDYVFVRGPLGRVRGKIDRLGEVPADKLAGPVHPLWPSDHAGLAAELVAPAGLVAAAP